MDAMKAKLINAVKKAIRVADKAPTFCQDWDEYVLELQDIANTLREGLGIKPKEYDGIDDEE